MDLFQSLGNAMFTCLPSFRDFILGIYVLCGWVVRVLTCVRRVSRHLGEESLCILSPSFVRLYSYRSVTLSLPNFLNSGSV